MIRLSIVVALAATLQLPKDFRTYKAPEITKSNVWINSAPITLNSLRGKVVVLDFWAFDSAPSVEAMPRVVELQDKYGKSGLVVIGVHTPRTDSEKDPVRLREAITKMGITFHVLVDNKGEVFRDYRCDLWPSQFVIDRNGMVRYSHGGAGRYEDLEDAVKKVLAMGVFD